jgi:hypothetical protein
MLHVLLELMAVPLDIILKKTIIIKRKKIEYLNKNGGDPFSKLVYKISNAVSRKHLNFKNICAYVRCIGFCQQDSDI